MHTRVCYDHFYYTGNQVNPNVEYNLTVIPENGFYKYAWYMLSSKDIIKLPATESRISFISCRRS